MPIHEIRETIELGQGATFLEKGTAQSKVIFQKRINLQAGKVHRMLQTDFFLDNPFTEIPKDAFWQFYVTPLPVIYTDMRYGPYLNVGPAAGNNYVLYKANIIQERPIDGFETLRIQAEFPNDNLGTFPTFDWYSPHLYLTLIVTTSGEEIINLGPTTMTFYAAVESKNVSYVKSMCGRMKERQEAHIATIMNNGHYINPARNSGQIFPMWRHGGVRPSGMLAADQFGQFALPGDGQDAERMWNNNDLLAVASAGRTMVSTPDPFGDIQPPYGFIPDWLVMDLPMGIQFGPIRDQMPQTLYNDAGILRMV